MTTTIKLPRAHKKRLKAFDSLNEVNRWGSDVDARIDEIINSLGTTQRAIRELDRASGAASLGAHAATHRPASGSDPLSTAAPTSILGGTSSNSVGVGDSFARNDHSHDVATAAPAITLGTVAAEGSSNSLVRIDSTIVAFDATAPADVSVSAGAVGSAAFAAHRDHVHRLVESTLTLGNLGGTLAISKGGTGQTSAANAFAALSPANTKGDLIGHDGAAQGRLPVGTNGQILRADSTATFGFAWQNASFNENIFEVYDNLDNTKILQFNPGTITTGNTRTMNVPDANGTLALLNGQLGATAAVTDVRGIRTTTGPTLLTIGAVADGEFLKRVGATVVGAAAGGGSTPTGTGFRHVTAGVEDAAAKLVDTADINADQVTYAKIQNVSASLRFLGRINLGAGDIEELTGTQATSLLDAFTSTVKGLAPASGGGTSNFLRADGTWAAPTSTPDIKAATITAPYDSYDYSEVVVDAAVTGSSQILLGWGTTTVDDENTPDMEDINFQAIPGAGQFTAYISTSSNNSFGGVFRLNYLAG